MRTKVPKGDKLTIKQKKWIKAYMETGNATEAAMQVYDCSDRNSARAIGGENLANLSIDKVMEAQGLTDEFLIEKLNEGLQATKVISANIVQIKSDDPTVKQKEAHSKTQDFVDVEDYAVRHKYLETALKLKNKFPDSKANVNVQGDLNVQYNIVRGVKDNE